jgi:hypothetical protein
VWQEFKKKIKRKEEDQFNGDYEKPEDFKSVFAWSCCLNENHDAEVLEYYLNDKKLYGKIGLS